MRRRDALALGAFEVRSVGRALAVDSAAPGARRDFAVEVRRFGVALRVPAAEGLDLERSGGRGEATAVAEFDMER
ncbi:MAG: hypothetical protein KF724_03585 [Phycisphaeraceae bacterium]|nr:hypothetical protein [Phycisphaeraceae bacterium]